MSGGWGEGGAEVISGNTEFCTFSCSPKAAVPSSNRTLAAIHLFLKLLIGSYLVNLAGNVKMH